MPTPAPQAFRELVERRLADLAISKYELGQRAGLSANLVYRWWKDLTPTDVSLRKIAPVLEVPLEDLMRAAGRLDPDVAETALAPTSALTQALNRFANTVRGVPEVFQLAVVQASIRLAEGLPDVVTPVTAADDLPVTAPDPSGNKGAQTGESGLPIWKQEQMVHRARTGFGFVTLRPVATS